MKKILLSASFVIVATGVFAQMGHSAYTLESSSAVFSKTGSRQNIMPWRPDAKNERNAAPTALSFNNDITIKPDTLDQRHVKITTAFNGWIFSAFTINNSTSGGIQVMVSKDGGFTWTNFASGLYANVDYPSIDLAVAGNDTASLTVFLAGVYHDLSSGMYSAWVDRYHGTTGTWLSESFNENNATSAIYDIAIATDYRHPSYLSIPYSIGVVYSKTAAYDSVIYAASIDAGQTYTVRQGAFATPRFTRKVDIAFGIGSTYSNGRYIMAFERYQNYNDTMGNIYFTHTTIDPTSTLQAAIDIDSVAPGSAGRVRDPHIAASNDGLDNDSSNITTVVAAQMYYSGSDWDVVQLYSKATIYSAMQNWHESYIEGSSLYEAQPDIAFNENGRRFYVTCFDSTNKKLIADTNGVNLTVPTAWSSNRIAYQYNDLTTNVRNPWPSLSIDPVSGTSNYAWNSEGATNGVALFDAELNPTAVAQVPSFESGVLLYPNPSDGNITFNYSLDHSGEVTIRIFNMLGQPVSANVNAGTQLAGNYVMPVDLSSLVNGMYLYQFTIGNKVYSGRFNIVH